MIESLVNSLKETIREGYNSSSLVPNFFKDITSETKSFKEADMPLNDRIKTKNDSLEGTSHPNTNIEYASKSVEVDGEIKEGVFPKFDSEFDVNLPVENYQSSDGVQFRYANNELKEAVKDDSKLKEKFNDEQLDDILNGDTPEGYTWHHSEEKGKLELVDKETHAKSGHTGGRAIWGGGTESR